jgi:hypothetical protein
MDFSTGESSAAFESHRIQPKLGNFIVALNMNMGRLASIACIKEQPIRPKAQNCRHASLSLQQPGGVSVYGASRTSNGSTFNRKPRKSTV